MADHATPKSRTLGAALREAREAKKISLRGLAGELELDPSRLSKWETGKQVPKDTVVSQILTHLGVTGDRYDEIVAMTAGADAGTWLAVTLPEQRQHLAALLDLEATAKMITSVSPLLIPGVLQEGEYVRAIMSAGDLPSGEISTRVATRLGRRDTIARRTPAQLRAFIGEAALRQVIGSRTVMEHQLSHLLLEAERPNVEIRVVTFDSGWHSGLEGPFSLIDPRPGEGIVPVVHIENRRSGLFLHEVEDVATYRQAVDTVVQAAMSPADTKGLIADVIKEMRTR
ncbi:helix-turn-helix domain-containing protein [Amycolatopsis sp. H20-H5]|uniref:helix-turn-helix domain-containing protein n=1 Tax=Amycolatopsis sp. H20-H5 TaxID=3046309 RepID=UPI002DB7375E|nr:helix-turn-helix transcriptional regulator [Amycolatopsis sp. H20-H5]MEC3976159.1 helix-turn-helix transcriptional regulator [Amycolatopsis sp. H20-H5]